MFQFVLRVCTESLQRLHVLDVRCNIAAVDRCNYLTIVAATVAAIVSHRLQTIGRNAKRSRGTSRNHRGLYMQFSL